MTTVGPFFRTSFSTAGIGELERIVVDIAVAVEMLAVQQVLDDRVDAGELGELGVVNPGIHMHEADAGQLFLVRIAARGAARDAAGRVIRAVGEAPLAPGVVAIALHHRCGLVGDDGDRAQMIGVEVAGGDGLIAALEAHADHRPANRQVLVPLADGAGAEELHIHAEGVEITGGAFRGHLLEPLMVDVVLEADGEGALRDARGPVVGRIRDVAPEPGGLIADGVVGEGGVDGPATDARNRVRSRRAGRRIAIGAVPTSDFVSRFPISLYVKVLTNGVGDSATVADVTRLRAS